MGLRFRKSIKILPGVKINLSKSGISTSIGKRGSTVNFSNRGTRTTFGIPGTGLSYSTSVGKRRKTKRQIKQELEDSEKKTMATYGLSKATMRKFERRFKRHPQKYRCMSEQQILAVMKKDQKRIRSRNIFLLFVLLIFLICVLIASFNQNT